MKRKLLSCFFAGLLLNIALIISAHASSTIITFSVDEATNVADGTFNPPPGGTDAVYVRGTFDGWATPGLQLVEVGSSTVYTNTANDTSDANGGNLSYIYHDTENGDEGPADWANRAAYLPTNSGATLVLGTAFFDDIGPATNAAVTFQVDMSEELELGHFHPLSGDTVVIAGSFQGWSISAGAPWIMTNNPYVVITNNNFNPPVIESNVYTATESITLNARYAGVATPNCAEDFKYVEMPEANWESPGFPNADSGGNRFFTEGNQTLPLVSFNDSPYSRAATVTLNVDMTGVDLYDTNYVPDSVTAWGSFNGWSGGVPMTNNPATGNTNLYSATVTMGEGASFILQYRYTNSTYDGWVYDYAQDGGPYAPNNNNYRRTINLPITPTILTTNFPTVYFNDLAPDDFLPVDTAVTFSVDMNGAVGTDLHAFVPGVDAVYIDGMFAGATPSDPNPANGTSQYWYPFTTGANPVAAPPGYEMVEVGSTTIYTNTIIIPRGTPVALSYQYGMDEDSVSGGPAQNEAAAGIVHYRVVRSTAFDPYVMPTDTFTNQPYQEPIFSTGNIGGIGNPSGGDLTIGAVSGGSVPVSWLGRPGAQLEVSTSLTGAAWQKLAATDGTNWNIGTSSSNGFVSQTNWPASSNTYFRLVKP